MQRDSAHQLHIERSHPQHAFGCLSHRRKRIRQHIVHRRDIAELCFQLVGNRAQVVVVHVLELRLKRVYLGNQRFQAFQDLLVRVPDDL